MHAGAHCRCASELEYVDGDSYALDRNGPERFDLYKAFRKPKRFGGNSDGPRQSQLLHSRGKVGRLSDAREDIRLCPAQ